MKPVITMCALIALATSSVAQEPVPAPIRGEAAECTSRDATVLSIMGWGISLAVGVAALSALIDNSGSGHTH